MYLSDLFLSDIIGGAEQNDFELIQLLKDRNIEVNQMYSKSLSLDFLRQNKNQKYIISNFTQVDKFCLEYLTENCDYIIYEHDHKYLTTRDPSWFDDYLAPKESIINESFYNKAIAVITQSNLHKSIVQKNLPNANVISVGGNLWSDEFLNKAQSLWTPLELKRDVYSIMDSIIPHKNTSKTVAWCKQTNRKYELIGPKSHIEFLTSLSKNKYLVFNPLTVETLSRIVVEARMVGCSVLSNKNRVGAFSESWIEKSGHDLIEHMRAKREFIPNLIIELFNEESSST